jgi:hypothetical protein
MYLHGSNVPMVLLVNKADRENMKIDKGLFDR